MKTFNKPWLSSDLFALNYLYRDIDCELTSLTELSFKGNYAAEAFS